MTKTRLASVLALTLALAGSAFAEGTAAPPTTGPAPAPTVLSAPNTSVAAAPAPAPGTHTITAEDLHAFLDGMIPYAIHRGDIAGATIAVVKDGRLVFAQGYGYANVQKRTPVIADQTMFRPGSVSKTFTWTAVMQLVEQGKLDLDKDVNSYIDFKIPEKFGKPITLRDIMTHTGGFEETLTDLFVGKKEQLYPLGQYLPKRMPERIFPPGKVVAYSNYATTIAGYIVQRVSGEPFDQYIANHILKPLHMDHSTFAQPLPANLQPFMADGYSQASAQKSVGFEYVEAAPAGALSATATDMAKFMMAHLNHGSYGGYRMLKPETEAQMQTRNHTLAPGLNGFDLGFYDENRNGHRIVGHAGDTTGFHSDLHLITDANVGVFMSFNSGGKEGAVQEVRTSVFRNFLDRYFPYTPPEEKTVANPQADAARVAGDYMPSRRKESSLYVLSLLSQSAVAANPDGTISVAALRDPSGAEKKWREVGPLLYREVGGQTHTKFMTDENGAISYWVSDDFFPVEEPQRVYGLTQTSVLNKLVIISIAVLALTIAIWFGGWVVRRRFGRPLEMEPRMRRLRLASRIGAVLLLAVPVGWMGFITLLSSDDNLLFGGGVPPLMILLYVIGLLSIFGALAVIAHTVLRVLNGPGRWLVKIGETVLALVALYGIYAVLAYGLANFNTNI
ncbi:MAG TPA: serine hydrolase [Rhizomicrobium sp.]|jgi:CubicO group peptidase (beta-lactamase class C family)